MGKIRSLTLVGLGVGGPDSSDQSFPQNSPREVRAEFNMPSTTTVL